MTCMMSRAPDELASKGTLPVTIANRMIPSEYRSDRRSTGRDRARDPRSRRRHQARVARAAETGEEPPGRCGVVAVGGSVDLAQVGLLDETDLQFDGEHQAGQRRRR